MMKVPSSGESRDAEVRRVGLALQDMIRAVEAARESAAREQHLHPTDFSCISLLYRASEPLSPTQLIAYLRLTSGSGTALLDRLERAGYIRRLPNPEDRRGVLIELDVEKAAEPIARYKEIEQVYSNLTGELSEDNLAVIANFLEQMVGLTIKVSEGFGSTKTS